MSSSSGREDDSSSADDSSEEFYDAIEPSSGTLLRFTNKVLSTTPRNRVDLTTLSASEVDSYASDSFFSTGMSSLNQSQNVSSSASITSLAKVLYTLEFCSFHQCKS